MRRALGKVRDSIFLILSWVLLSAPALAHSPVSSSEEERLPLILGAGLLLLFHIAYWRGAKRRWPGLWRFLGFNGTGVLAAFTLFGPLDGWAETNAALHMTQHMLMMTVIAPLWVITQPLPQLLAPGTRMGQRLLMPFLKLARYPIITASLHGAVIWFWHAPRLYLLALENPWLHVVEHACFLLTAGLFWWSVLRCSYRNAPYALLALLFTLMHTGLLGALLTFADAPLYGEARDLHSQQLAGLIMWVLGGFPYLAASSWVGARWFQQILRRSVSSKH